MEEGLLNPLDYWAFSHAFEYLGIPLTASQIQDLVSGNVVPKPTGIEVKRLEVTISEVKTIK